MDPVLKELIIDAGLVAGGIGSAAVVWSKVLKPVAVCARNSYETIQNLDYIAKELKPNGGSSLRDSVNRISERVETLAGIQHALYEDSPSAIFRCDLEGSNIEVNRTYCHLLGASRGELLGFGWRNYMEPVDRQAYDDEWKDAFKHCRPIDVETQLRLITTNNHIQARIRTYPLIGPTGSTAGFIGVIDIINMAAPMAD